MFSITIPAFALYFLLGASRKKSLNYALSAAITLYSYRFFYASGQSITSALAVAYIGYLLGLILLEYFFCHYRNWKKAISSKTSVFVLKSISWLLLPRMHRIGPTGQQLRLIHPGFFLAYLFFCHGFFLGQFQLRKSKLQNLKAKVNLVVMTGM